MTAPHYVFYGAAAGAIASCEAMLMSKPADVTCEFLLETDSANTRTSCLASIRNSREALLSRIQNSKSVAAVILGPRHDSTLTQSLLRLFHTRQYPTVMITDHWGTNYLAISGGLPDPLHPTLVLSIDRSVTNELTIRGVSPQSIVEVGHIGISHKLMLMSKMTAVEIQKLQFNLDIPGTNLILLALEVILDSSVKGEDQYWMIDELDAALNLIGVTDSVVLVRPHPADNPHDCQRYIESRNLTSKFVLCPQSLSDWEAITIAKVIVGSNSTILALALANNTSAIVLTYGTGARSTIPWLREQRVGSTEELTVKLNAALTTGLHMPRSDLTPLGAVNRAWHAIRQIQVVPA